MASSTLVALVRCAMRDETDRNAVATLVTLSRTYGSRDVFEALVAENAPATIINRFRANAGAPTHQDTPAMDDCRCKSHYATLDPCGLLGGQTFKTPPTPPRQCNEMDPSTSGGYTCVVGGPGMRWVLGQISLPPGETTLILKTDRDAFLRGLELFYRDGAATGWADEEVYLRNWERSSAEAIYETWGDDYNGDAPELVEMPSGLFTNAGWRGAGGPSGTYRPTEQRNSWIPDAIVRQNLRDGRVSVVLGNDSLDTYKLPFGGVVHFTGTSN